MQRGNPEVTWEIDPVAAGRVGLTVEQVANQMSAAWLGDVPTELRLLDRRIPVRVRLEDRFRFDASRLPQTLIRATDGGLVPVSSLAHTVRANGQAELLRENLRQMALVSGRLEGRDMGSAVAEIESNLRHVKLPVGYTYEIGGQYASQQQAFRELLMVFGIAAVLVFTILVIQFRAWAPAFLILLAAPLSLGGALLLLWLTGTDLNVSSAMGCILLVGLVVKNGIMLLDFSERLHAGRGSARRRDRARRPHPPAADSHDDLLHAVRPAAARARPGRRGRAAEAAGARGHRRADALDSRDAPRCSRAVLGNQVAPRSFRVARRLTCGHS